MLASHKRTNVESKSFLEGRLLSFAVPSTLVHQYTLKSAIRACKATRTSENAKQVLLGRTSILDCSNVHSVLKDRIGLFHHLSFVSFFSSSIVSRLFLIIIYTTSNYYLSILVTSLFVNERDFLFSSLKLSRISFHSFQSEDPIFGVPILE